MTNYLEVMNKFAVFSGRARRQEYWMFVLANAFIAFGIAIVGALLKFPAAIFVYQVLIIVPSMSAAVRRMHDTNRSGWWLLVPIAGFVFLCLDGDKGANRFGPNPKDQKPKEIPVAESKAS